LRRKKRSSYSCFGDAQKTRTGPIDYGEKKRGRGESWSDGYRNEKLS